jgi:MFS family permease
VHDPGVTATADRESERRATRRLLFLGIPLFWSSLYVYNSYLSVYARSLGASLSLVGIIVGAYGFTQLALRIPVGIASDRLGQRKSFVLAGALAGALGCAAMLIAPDPWVLVLGRSLAGVAAACWVTLSVLLVSTYPGDQVIRATSIASALSGAGTTVASAMGGQIAQMTNERVPFWVGIGLGLATLVALSQIREPQRTTGRSLAVLELLAVGKVRMVLVVSIMALLNQYVSWAMTFSFVPIYAADLGATKTQLGIMMSVWQGCSAFMAFWAGHANARLGMRWTVACGLAMVAISVLLTPTTRTFGPLLALRTVHGIGTGLVSPVLMGGALLAVPESKRGAAMGFFQAIYAIGMVAGPAVSGVLADSFGLVATFYITGVLALGTILAAALFLPHRIRQPEATPA